MAVKLKDIAPQDIERESFRIIERELGQTPFPHDELAVVRRMIHATGDFDFAKNVRFYPGAVEAGIRAVLSGKDILVDVTMALQGVSKRLLQRFGGQVICHIGDEHSARLAREKGITRAAAGIELATEEDVGIVAIGNAPTALIRTIKLVKQGLFSPDLIIGVPVGFVNAAESKQMLLELDHPWITTLGRKGGTPIAVATVNAILHLCKERMEG